jgi:hypothetical protein
MPDLPWNRARPRGWAEYKGVDQRLREIIWNPSFTLYGCVIVKCSSKTLHSILRRNTPHRTSAVILLPSLPCKIASPRGLSVTPWGFTTHTHKPLSLAMLPTFTPNSNPNQPCFYLSDLSSPIFSFYILFI